MKLNRFRISIFSLTYIFIALISNHLFYLSIFYFICLFHELFHYFMAKALNIYVDEMVLYPFGFVLKINTLIYEKEWKQYLVLIFGPLSFFFSYSIFLLTVLISTHATFYNSIIYLISMGRQR